MKKPTGKLAFAYQTITSLEAKLTAAQAEAKSYRRDLEAEQSGALELRRKYGAQDHETMFCFVARLHGETAQAQAEALKWQELADKYKWQVRDTCARAEKAEAEARELQARTEISERGVLAQGALIEELRAELARVREALSDYYHQHRCGCGHPSCKRCRDDRHAEAALSQPAEQTAPISCNTCGQVMHCSSVYPPNVKAYCSSACKVASATTAGSQPAQREGS